MNETVPDKVKTELKNHINKIFKQKFKHKNPKTFKFEFKAVKFKKDNLDETVEVDNSGWYVFGFLQDVIDKIGKRKVEMKNLETCKSNLRKWFFKFKTQIVDTQE